ncbi:M14 family zinc carboxypeptidase, partial [Geminisphaera colitermitum]|uniref:M14 family zinc carboxypeptidase n=1 Tax=Geminisphaera colitermitum TaxID=1148786 RepID=UPI0005BA8424
YTLPRITFSGPRAPHDTPLRIGLFGGLHGDEPASVDALLVFAERLATDPTLATGYELTIYPVINPTGLEDGTRVNRAGVDLNREFWQSPPSPHPEIRILENELRTRRFNGLITLHADDTSEGVYGYTHGHILNEALLEPALRAASLVLPRDRRAKIDGFAAADGKISRCFTGILASPPDQRPKPFDLIFETPGLAPHDQQVEAAVLALETILDEYRVFLAHAQYL